MLTEIAFALVVIGSAGDERVVAQFQTREQCLHEAKLVREQGPSAFCFPTNQLTQADLQKQFDMMLRLMDKFRREMEIQQ